MAIELYYSYVVECNCDSSIRRGDMSRDVTERGEMMYRYILCHIEQVTVEVAVHDKWISGYTQFFMML